MRISSAAWATASSEVSPRTRSTAEVGRHLAGRRCPRASPPVRPSLWGCGDRALSDAELPPTGRCGVRPGSGVQTLRPSLPSASGPSDMDLMSQPRSTVGSRGTDAAGTFRGRSGDVPDRQEEDLMTRAQPGAGRTPDELPSMGSRCPGCGSPRVRTIVYGYPEPELMNAAERGEEILGGCVLGDADPGMACLDCGERWGSR